MEDTAHASPVLGFNIVKVFVQDIAIRDIRFLSVGSPEGVLHRRVFITYQHLGAFLYLESGRYTNNVSFRQFTEIGLNTFSLE